MNPRVILYSSIAGIILILVFFFVGKALGKSTPPDMVPLPNDPGAGGTGATGQLPSAGITAITDSLYDDIYSIWTRDSQPYIDLMALSDTDFVRVYNDWNARYYSKDQQTLKQAIDGEWLSATSFTFYNLKPQLMQRFSRLGLA